MSLAIPNLKVMVYRIVVLDGQAVTLEVPVLHLPMVTGSGASLLGQNWLPLNLNHALLLCWRKLF